MEQVVVKMDNEETNKKLLIAINLCTRMLIVFYSIFFNIFVFNITNKFTFVLLLNIVGQAMGISMQMIINKFINEKTAMKFYRISFLLFFLAILCTTFINQNTIGLVFVVVFVYQCAETFYYVPHEISTIQKTEKTGLAKFMGVHSMIGMTGAVLAPFISGYIINKLSYFVIFIIISIFALFAFILSFWIQNFYHNNQEGSVWAFSKEVHKFKKTKFTYMGYALFKSSNIVTTIILPVLMFLRVGSELSVGLYASAIAIFEIVCLGVYLKMARNTNLWVFVCAGINFVVSVLLLIIPTFEMFVIYYVAYCGTAKIIDNFVKENVYTLFTGTQFEAYKKQHHLTFSMYNYFSVISIFSITLLLCLILPQLIAISCLFVALSVSLTSSILLLIKAKKF